MALAQVIPLAEAAAFTVGCAVLNTRKFDPERVGVVLAVLLAALAFAVLIAGVATGAIDVAVLAPDELRTVFD